MKARRFLGNGDTFGGVTNLWSSACDHLRQFTAASRWTNGVVAHRQACSYDKAGNRASERTAAAPAGDRPSMIQRNTYLVGGGGVRVAGLLPQKGNVSIAVSKARILTVKASRLQFFWAVNGRGGDHTENTVKQIQALQENDNQSWPVIHIARTCLCIPLWVAESPLQPKEHLGREPSSVAAKEFFRYGRVIQRGENRHSSICPGPGHDDALLTPD